jgi:conjugal transfer mating pair stabilization protein TraG
MVFEIFSYWNMRELELVFNAVASIVGSGDYLGLMRTLAVVGLLSMAMAVLAGFSQLPDFGKWIIMFAVFNGMLLVPKVTVVLTDRTGTEAPRTVANVPIGLAAFAHSVSHIGDWLTTTFETTFSLPGDIQFRTNGTLFGHRVQQEILHTKFDNSILNSNLLEFYRECVVPEFSTGYIVASEMAKSNDIWTYLSGKTNPGRLVTIRAVPGATPAADTYGCDVAYTHLGTQIDYVNTQQMNAMGKRLYPGLPTAAANAALQSSIQTSTNYMLGISKNALDITKQTAMSNFMIDAQYMLPAQIGDAAGAAANLAQAQAIRSTSESYKLMAKLAESTMPKIKNLVEIVQYAIFPIIMLLILMAGHKGGLVLKAYVMSLVWIQLWPPLYAVMHLIMTIHSQELAAMTSGMGLSMAEYSQVNNAYISDEAIAGMIAATAIPMIASAIVKGGDVGAQAIGGMVAPTRESSQVASSMASGSFSMGSASLGSQSADNLSMNQVSARPTITQGGMSVTGSDNVSHFHGSNGEIINNSAAFQNIGANLKASGRTAGALTQTSEQLDSAALAYQTAASDSMAAARSQYGAFDQSHGKGTRTGTTATTGSTAQFMKATETEMKLAEKWGKEHGIKQEQMAEFMAYARADASGGVNFFGTGATVGAGTQATGKSGAGTSQVQKLAHEFAQTKEYKEAVQTADTASRQKDFATGEDAGSKAARGVRASLDESQAYVTSATATHTSADSYRDAASRVKEQAAGFDANANNQFMEWMKGQINPTTGKNFTASDVEFMSRNAPEDIGKYAQRFVDEKMVPEIDKTIPTPTNNIAAKHDQNIGKVGKPGEVLTTHSNNMGAVKDKQDKAGVTIGKGPVDTVSPAADQLLDRATQQVNLANSGITAGGQPLKDSVTANTDPTRQNNMGLAAQNAAASVLPEGTMKIMDSVGLVSADAGRAKPAADSFKGDLVDAAIDTAVFAGSMAIGGPVGGKLVNKGLGEAGSIVARGGNAAGKAAENTAEAVAGAAERRLATAAAKAEGAGEAAAAEAARKAAEHTTTNAGVTAAKAGAEAEVKAAQTIDGLGKGAGVVGGGALANQATGEDGLLNKPAIKETNDAVMGVVDDLTGQNEPPASGRVSSGKIKYPSDPNATSANNEGTGTSESAGTKAEGAGANTGQAQTK